MFKPNISVNILLSHLLFKLYIDNHLYVCIISIDDYLCEVMLLDIKYKDHALLFKALSDPNRLMIMDMLSCGELCACVILEKFKITQPTLSHHMKNLCDCGLVVGRKEGKWIYYSLNEEVVQSFRAFLEEVTSSKENSICYESNVKEDCCK